MIFQINTNLLLTEGRTREYWPEVAAVRAERRANIPQYGTAQLRLVSCLLYGIVSLSDRTLLRFVNVRNLRLPQQTMNGNRLHVKLNTVCLIVLL